MYIDPNTKEKDNLSTAWSFTTVGVIGILCLILLNVGVIPFPVAASQRIIMTVVMGILFFIFLGVGISSFLSAGKLKEAAKTETALEKEIIDWVLKEHTDTIRGIVGEEKPDETEENYYPRYELICELIHDNYPTISEEFKDHLAEQIYSSIFPDS